MDDAPPSTVAVTGASGQVGRALLERLQLQTRRFRSVAVVRERVELPADEQIVGRLDSAPVGAMLGEADYVVHLAGSLRPTGQDSYQRANVESTEAVARAVQHGKARRLLMLSYVGAAPDAKNLYLRTKALAEQALARTGKDVVIFRCAHIIGPPAAPGPTALALRAAPGKAATVLGHGQQRVAPLYLGDAVSALVAALAGGRPGTYELVGPVHFAMDELVRLVNGDPRVRIRHVPGWLARLLALCLPGLPSPLVDVLLSDSLGDASRAVEVFGLQLTDLRTVWLSP